MKRLFSIVALVALILIAVSCNSMSTSVNSDYSNHRIAYASGFEPLEWVVEGSLERQGDVLIFMSGGQKVRLKGDYIVISYNVRK